VAIEFEKKLKKWSKAKKLALIEGRYDDLPNLSKKNLKNSSQYASLLKLTDDT